MAYNWDSNSPMNNLGTTTAVHNDIEVTVNAIKVTTDKLDDCINTGTNKLQVDAS